MNTAISSQWGFPKNCPGNCPCKKYDCLAPEWEKHCGFSEGFCDMVTNKLDVPEYKINWVRVYQNPDDETEKVGCSTPERPTRKWIEAHEAQYKRDGDVSRAFFLMFVFATGLLTTSFSFRVRNTAASIERNPSRSWILRPGLDWRKSTSMRRSPSRTMHGWKSLRV